MKKITFVLLLCLVGISNVEARIRTEMVCAGGMFIKVSGDNIIAKTPSGELVSSLPWHKTHSNPSIGMYMTGTKDSNGYSRMMTYWFLGGKVTNTIMNSDLDIIKETDYDCG